MGLHNNVANFMSYRGMPFGLCQKRFPHNYSSIVKQYTL
jgi:hypothetical protein